MDDLSAKISQILSDPESMNQLRAAAAALGLDTSGGPGPAQQQAPPPQQNTGGGGGMPDLSALAGLLGGLGGGGSTQQAPQQPMIDPKTIALVQGALSKLNSNDPNVTLLRALKPHFTPARSNRVDDAIRLIQLFSMLPVLRDSGILGGLFGGGGDNK